MSKYKSPLKELKISPHTSIRYWYDDDEGLHTAVWQYNDCVVTDTDQFNSIVKEMTLYILALMGLQEGDE